MKKLIASVKNIQFTEKSVPWILLTACILAFGLLIPKLGYFQDDWNFVFNDYAFGDKGLSQFMQYDGRPYAAWIFIAGFKLLGFKPLYWHIAELLIRWLTGLTFWLIFRTLWPKQKWQALGASLLFLLYPFFTLQPLATTYTLHWTGYLLYSLSIYFMLQAVRKKSWLFTSLALFTQIAHLMTIEYYAGIDLIRPIFLWFLLSNAGKSNWQEKLKGTFLNWLPYLLVFALYFIWRGFLYQSPNLDRSAAAGLSELLANPVQTIIYYLTKGIPDVVLILISSWCKILEPEMFDLSDSSNRFILAIRIIGFAVIYVYLNKFQFNNISNNKSNTRLKQIATLGVAGLLAGLLPAYGAGYIVHTKLFPWNSRFSLGSLFGAALLITAVLELLITSQKMRNVTLALLACLLIGWHLDYTNDFRWAWDKQVNFYRQLYLRAPEITPGTAILSEEEFLMFMGDYPASYGINLIYADQEKDFGASRTADYWLFPFAEFYMNFDQHLAGEPFSTVRAGTTFDGELEGSIVISFEPGLGQCLWVMRPEYASSKSFSQTMRQLASLSYVDRIKQAPLREDSFLLKYLYTRPEQDWCYYYQKADLAYQYEEWDEVIQLWETARQNDLQPENGLEYLPFIEAYAHTGDWETAKSMTRTSQKTLQGIDPLLCDIWSGLENNTPDSTEKDATLASVKEDLRCDQE
ncbi:MAG: hypothetical protein JW963_04490 [Anaerolineales bacterium]|nr:hypothetical protein [Anaerolineales bacterium]